MACAYIYDIHKEDGTPVAVLRFEGEDGREVSMRSSRAIEETYPGARFYDVDLFTELDGTVDAIWQLVIE